MVARKTQTYTAGDEVDSKCTKCKLVLAHTVLAMVGDRIARVKCNTCGGAHAYRPPPSPSEATAARRRAERKSASQDSQRHRSGASEFDNLTQGIDLTKPEKYSAKMQLALRAVVEHPSFGVGLVTELREGNKAHIAFKEGGRILVYAR